MKKKILIFTWLFIFLIVIAFLLEWKGKGTAKNFNPFQNTDNSKITKILIDQPDFSVALEKKNNVWNLTQPISDIADAQLLDRMVGVFTNFSVGSIISEGKSHYNQFDIQDASATRLRIFADGAANPSLDGRIGKQGAIWGSAYFRFEGKDPVYVANDLPVFVIPKSTEAFRSRQLFNLKQPEISDISVVVLWGEFHVQRSSHTWFNVSASSAADTSQVQTIISKIGTLQAIRFGTGNESALSLGFEKPFLTVSVQSSSETTKAVFGNLIPKADKKAPGERYAQVDGRPAILIVPDELVGQLIGLIPATPKPKK